jgi:hypothetical protein
MWNSTAGNFLGRMPVEGWKAYGAFRSMSPVYRRISVCSGFSKSGLPIGLQIVARAFKEDVLLQVAYAYEQFAGWHRKKPPLPS